MFFPKLTIVSFVILMTFSSHAQYSRNNEKSSNVYRSFHQRFALGSTHTLEIRSGSLWSWGDNTYGQLGDGGTTNRTSAVRIGVDSNWSLVAAGLHHTLAIKMDGTLWAWGRNQVAQLGDGTYVNKSSPIQIGTSNNWVAVGAGDDYSIATNSKGEVHSWGNNTNGQLGNRSNTSATRPAQMAFTSGNKLAAGRLHVLQIEPNGNLYGWGNNAYGQVGDTTTTNRNAKVLLKPGSDWAQVAAGSAHSIAIKSNGTLWAWGNNTYGQLGDGTNVDKHFPVQIGADADWVSISALGNHTLALKANGTLWSWGRNDLGQLGINNIIDKNIPTRVGTDNNWVAIAAGDRYSAALKVNGTTWFWGNNEQGQLGNSSIISTLVPVSINKNVNYLSVSMGAAFGVALASDGNLWSWGSNDYGELGNGTTTKSFQPVKVSNDTNWVNVVTGSTHVMAIRADGSLWTWGNNYEGQLGNGNLINQSVPVRVGTDNDWANISSYGNHSLALKANGTLWAWGDNAYGQLGLGNFTDSQTPQQVGTDQTWTSISAGGNHSVAIKANGTIWVWGNNDDYRLGLGAISGNKSLPTQIGFASNWLTVSAGTNHTMAIQSDGTLWTWGRNDVGKLGDNTSVHKNAPQKIAATVNSWTKVKAGSSHSMALQSDGSVWTWGMNTYGHLGDAGISPKSVPTNLSSQSNVSTISAGYYQSGLLKMGQMQVCATKILNVPDLLDNTVLTNGFNCNHSSLLAVLPVKWNGFTAVQNHQVVVLQWSTAQEQNSKEFIIQYSVDGTSWTNISTVPASGNSNHLKEYSYVHSSPAIGANYYRIHQVDLDRKTSVSETRWVNMNTGASQSNITLLQNPVTDGVLKFKLEKSGELRLYNAQGALVMTRYFSAGNGVLQVGGFAKGIYYIWNAGRGEKIMIK